MILEIVVSLNLDHSELFKVVHLENRMVVSLLVLHDLIELLFLQRLVALSLQDIVHLLVIQREISDLNITIKHS